jgi:hypothetical protein
MVLVAVGQIHGIRPWKFVPVDFHRWKIIIELLEMQAEQTGIRQQGGFLRFKQKAGVAYQCGFHRDRFVFIWFFPREEALA